MNYNTITLFAPAKINLFLHITGKRADGYHLLQSLMVFADVGDEITFFPHDSLFIDVQGPFANALSDPRENLVYKACEALAQEYNVPMKAKIILKKNLPIASGLGGGSSNAAVTLKGLRKLWSLPEQKTRMMRVAEKLGADVPACYEQRPLWAEGIGEKMTHLTGMPELYLLLVNPGVHTSTPAVFNQLRGRFSSPIQFTGRKKTMQEWIADLVLYRNDLTRPAEQIAPAIHTVLNALENTPNCRLARLSGSGATCFGIYDNLDTAKAALNKIKAEYPMWWITTTTTS